MIRTRRFIHALAHIASRLLFGAGIKRSFIYVKKNTPGDARALLRGWLLSAQKSTARRFFASRTRFLARIGALWRFIKMLNGVPRYVSEQWLYRLRIIKFMLNFIALGINLILNFWSGLFFVSANCFKSKYFWFKLDWANLCFYVILGPVVRFRAENYTSSARNCTSQFFLLSMR